MNMREKITFAIANADDNAHVVLGRGAFTNAEWKGFERIADAVLDALMEPTEGMIEVGEGHREGYGHVDGLKPHATDAIFIAMIRAAKEGK